MSIDNPNFVHTPENIKNPSQDLLIQAIDTFPIKPVFGKVELAILDEEEIYKYSEKFHRLYYNYDSETYEPGAFDRNIESPNRIEVIVGEEGLDKLKTSLLPALIKRGFSVTYAALATTSYHKRDDGGTGSLGGEYMDAGVIMSRKVIAIEQGKCTPEQEQAVTGWFNTLQATSQNPQE